MPIPEFSIQLFELGIYHQLDQINSVQTLIVNDGDLSPEEAHILHTLITDENSPETAIIALKILAQHFEVDARVGNICRFKDFED